MDVHSALCELDNEFHGFYDQLVRKKVKDFHSIGIPVMLVISNDVIFYHRGKRHQMELNLQNYNTLKAVNHIILSVFIVLLGDSGTEDEKKTIERLYDKIQQILLNFTEEHVPGNTYQACTRILEQSLLLCKRKINGECIDEGCLQSIILKRKGEILNTLQVAQEDRLFHLKQIHQKYLEFMDDKEKQEYIVVIPTSHQASAGEITKSYFLDILGQKEGVGALYENRVLSPEDIWEENEILEFVVTHMIDRSIGKAFFGDPERMQRDVLACNYHVEDE